MLIGYIGIFVTMVNVKDDLSFYTHAKHITGVVKSKTTDDKDENNTIIKIAYIVKDEEHSISIERKGLEAESYEISQEVNLFYNSENPQECRTGTRSVVSIYFIVFILAIIGTYGGYLTAIHIYTIILNKFLIKNNNTVLADFYKIKKRKSYYNTNKGIENYVICKYTKDGQEYTFSSMVMYNDIGHYLKNKQIKVFVDPKNIKKYLVDINDINTKIVKE